MSTQSDHQEVEKTVKEQKRVENSTSKTEKLNLRAENTLNTLASIALICGILVAVIQLISTLYISNEYGYRVYNPKALEVFVTYIFEIILAWGVLRVIANISKSLKEINSKIK